MSNKIIHTDHSDTETALLNECMDLLEWATYHDGRYDQFKSQRWQDLAQPLVVALGNWLDRKPYDGFGKGE